MELIIRKDIYEEMINWMKAHIPLEACGLLSGNGNMVDKFIKMENIAKSENFFEMDPVELMNALDEIDESGKDFIGIFHSHPITQPYPSKTDLDRNQAIDHVIFVISSYRNGYPEIKGYTIANGNIQEIAIIIQD